MQVIAITGASAGVGQATAKAFAATGARVGLIARNSTALEKVKSDILQIGGEALVLPCDVADSEAVEAAAERLEETFGPIDIWVNCAMVTVFSRVRDMTPEEFRRVSDVTYHGYIFGSMSALKRMLPRNKGHIIQIGSALAYRSIPLQSAYCGAKHAVRGFTDTLRSELIHEKSSVKLSMVQLPAFNTPQFTWARNKTLYQSQPLPPIYQPQLAAEAILWTARNPQREVWVGLPTWKAILGNKLLPGFLDRYLARKAWYGQLTNIISEPERPDNLFDSVESLHSERGLFDEQAVNEKPLLWHVRNQNFWINGSAFIVLLIVFFTGVAVGN